MLIIIINIFIIIIVYLPVLEHKFQESRKLVSIVHWVYPLHIEQCLAAIIGAE